MSFGVLRNNPNPNPFWKELLLATLPVTIASIGPIIVEYFLMGSKDDNSKATVKEELKRDDKEKNHVPGDNDKSG